MNVLNIIALIVLSFTFNLNAQFSADYTSNRKLGLLNDAGAVAWNPAMLGVISGVDVLGAVPLDASFGKVHGYAGFIKIGNYAFGLENLQKLCLFQTLLAPLLDLDYPFNQIIYGLVEV